MPEKRARIVREIEGDHADIAHDLGELKLALMQETTEEKFSDWRLNLVWQLRDFQNRLLKHFDREEEGGFMTEVVKEAPHLAREVDALKVEHGAVKSELDAILWELKEMPVKDEARLAEIRRALEAMMMRLREHERREQVLMQKAFYREYGAQD